MAHVMNEVKRDYVPSEESESDNDEDFMTEENRIRLLKIPFFHFENINYKYNLNIVLSMN